MEFDYSTVQSNMDMNNTDRHVELEGDVLYADIRRQILLLTADEDEDVHKDKRRNSFSSPVKSSTNSLSTAILQPGSYFNWWENENSNTVPAWLVNLWNNGNGTGVFIPQIVRSRRYYNPAGMCLISFFLNVKILIKSLNSFFPVSSNF